MQDTLRQDAEADARAARNGHGHDIRPHDHVVEVYQTQDGRTRTIIDGVDKTEPTYGEPPRHQDDEEQNGGVQQAQDHDDIDDGNHDVASGRQDDDGGAQASREPVAPEEEAPAPAPQPAAEEPKEEPRNGPMSLPSVVKKSKNQGLRAGVIFGGFLAIGAQAYLWGNVFVTLFKPNRMRATPPEVSPPAPPAPSTPSPGADTPEAAFTGY